MPRTGGADALAGYLRAKLPRHLKHEAIAERLGVTRHTLSHKLAHPEDDPIFLVEFGEALAEVRMAWAVTERAA